MKLPEKVLETREKRVMHLGVINKRPQMHEVTYSEMFEMSEQQTVLF